MQIEAAQNKALYGLVGRCLVTELDSDAVTALRSPAILSVLGKLDDKLDGYLVRDWNEGDYEEAAAEFCALFVLPKGVTQIASSWIPGSTEDIGHKLVAGVRQILENFSLEVETLSMGNVPKDNVGLLSLLAAELYGIDEVDSSSHGDDFVQSYVAPWGNAFGQALQAKTKNPLYRAIGGLLVELVSDEAKQS